MKKIDYYIVDTNLLISSVLRENSTPDIGLQKIESLNGVLVFSSITFEELENVMRRPKFDKYVSLERREKALSFIAQLGLFVIPQKHFTHCRDLKDNKFLDAAVAGKVTALITGDRDLLDLEDIEGIPIITMAIFLEDAN